MNDEEKLLIRARKVGGSKMTIKFWDEGIEPFVFPTPEQPINPPNETPTYWGVVMCKPKVLITGVDKWSLKEKTFCITFIDPISVDLDRVEQDSQEESSIVIDEVLSLLENLLPRRCKVVLEELEVE